MTLALMVAGCGGGGGSTTAAKKPNTGNETTTGGTTTGGTTTGGTTTGGTTTGGTTTGGTTTGGTTTGGTTTGGTTTNPTNNILGIQLPKAQKLTEQQKLDENQKGGCVIPLVNGSNSPYILTKELNSTAASTALKNKTFNILPDCGKYYAGYGIRFQFDTNGDVTITHVNKPSTKPSKSSISAALSPQGFSDNECGEGMNESCITRLKVYELKSRTGSSAVSYALLLEETYVNEGNKIRHIGFVE